MSITFNEFGGADMRKKGTTIAVRKNGVFLQAPMLRGAVNENKEAVQLFEAVKQILTKLDDSRQTRLNCDNPICIAMEGTPTNPRFVIAVTNGMPNDQYGARPYDHRLLEFSLLAGGKVEVKQNSGAYTYTYSVDQIGAQAAEIAKLVPNDQ